MAVAPKNISEKQLADMMVDLFPLCSRSRYRPFDFTFDFGDCLPGSAGICLTHRGKKRAMRKPLREYAQLRNQAFEEVWGLVVENEVDVLVIDPDQFKHGGWKGFLLTAIHEFAHHVRGLFEDVYPTLSRNKYEHQDFLGGFDQYLLYWHPRGEPPPDCEPLFGDWAVRTHQIDLNAHDPLFYFVLYFLERKAADKGLLDMNARPRLEKRKWLEHYFSEKETKANQLQKAMAKKRKGRK